jgi:hypothetical protein
MILPVILAVVVAAADFPLQRDALDAKTQRIVAPVVEHYTLRREISPRTFQGRMDVFEFLVDHLEACSVLAESLGFIPYRARRDDEGRIFADDLEGAAGFLWLFSQQPDARFYYFEGRQRGLFTVRGRGIAVMNFRESSPNTIQYGGLLYIKVDNIILATLTQLFFPFVKSTVDRQFDNVIINPIRISELALTDPQKVLGKIQQMSEADRMLLEPLAKLLETNSENLAAIRGE